MTGVVLGEDEHCPTFTCRSSQNNLVARAPKFQGEDAQGCQGETGDHGTEAQNEAAWAYRVFYVQAAAHQSGQPYR